MTEEIKEILDKLEKVANRETASRNALMEMKDTDYRDLLDYITNLQQNYNKLQDDYQEQYTYEYNLRKQFQQENEKLKENLCENFIYERWYIHYKSRCEKAIEYIKFVINHYKEQLKTPIEDTYFDSDVNRKGYILSIIAYLQTILDILNGSDENV